MAHGGDIYRNKVNIDFSVSLNPLGTPQEVLRAVKNSVDTSDRYPDPLQEETRQIIADATGLKSSCVFAGNGASELLQAAVRAAAPKRALLFEPGFSGYRHALKQTDCEIIRHISDEDDSFEIKPEDTAIPDQNIDLVIISDPVNPTGLNLKEEDLKRFLKKAHEKKITVILDESFYPMSDKSAFTSNDRSRRLFTMTDDLFIIRSLTKVLAIPGIRAGYAAASPSNIEKLIGQLPEWNLSVTGEAAVKAGITLMSDVVFMKQTLDLIWKERDLLTRGLRKEGLKVFESDTSFILFKGPDSLYDELLECGILIRDLSDIPGLKKGFYRIAVKSREDNEQLLNALHKIRQKAQVK